MLHFPSSGVATVLHNLLWLSYFSCGQDGSFTTRAVILFSGKERNSKETIEVDYEKAFLWGCSLVSPHIPKVSGFSSSFKVISVRPGETAFRTWDFFFLIFLIYFLQGRSLWTLLMLLWNNHLIFNDSLLINEAIFY